MCSEPQEYAELRFRVNFQIAQNAHVGFCFLPEA